MGGQGTTARTLEDSDAPLRTDRDPLLRFHTVCSQYHPIALVTERAALRKTAHTNMAPHLREDVAVHLLLAILADLTSARASLVRRIPSAAFALTSRSCMNRNLGPPPSGPSPHPKRMPCLNTPRGSGREALDRRRDWRRLSSAGRCRQRHRATLPTSPEGRSCQRKLRRSSVALEMDRSLAAGY